MDQADQLFDTEKAGEYIQKPPATLAWWRVVGRGPRYLKIGRAVRYRKCHLDEFLEAAIQFPAHSDDAA